MTQWIALLSHLEAYYILMGGKAETAQHVVVRRSTVQTIIRVGQEEVVHLPHRPDGFQTFKDSV